MIHFMCKWQILNKTISDRREFEPRVGNEFYGLGSEVTEPYDFSSWCPNIKKKISKLTLDSTFFKCSFSDIRITNRPRTIKLLLLSRI